jgi:hypothetical protein
LKKLLLFLFFYWLQFGSVNAQVPPDTNRPLPDTVVRQDTLPPVIERNPVVKDSFSKKPAITNISANDSDWGTPAFQWKIMKENPYFGFTAPVTLKPVSERIIFQGKEWLFYGMILLLIIYGLLQRAFPKYFGDLFRLFFRTTLKQRQVKEQLMQTPLPSVLMNVFFVISAGVYISFIVEHFNLNPVDSFWLLAVYCCAGLGAIYFVKFVGLKVSGWLFSMQEAADSYIFIVFIINKMLGILLLPFLVLLAFSLGYLYTAALTLSICLIAALLIYRFILTYLAVRNQVKVNLFHFFLYICAFEIAPLLLIYKALLLFFPIRA